MFLSTFYTARTKTLPSCFGKSFTIDYAYSIVRTRLYIRLYVFDCTAIATTRRTSLECLRVKWHSENHEGT